MTSRWLPNRLKKGTGINSSTRAKVTDTRLTAHRATPTTRLMACRSWRPQYWLMSTAEPLCTPKKNSCMTNRGMLARVTAAIGTSPSMPTMKVSAMARVLVIRFCRMMGTARPPTRR